MSTGPHVIPLILTVAWLLNVAVAIMLTVVVVVDSREHGLVKLQLTVPTLLAWVTAVVQIGYWLGAWD